MLVETLERGAVRFQGGYYLGAPASLRAELALEPVQLDEILAFDMEAVSNEAPAPALVAAAAREGRSLMFIGVVLTRDGEVRPVFAFC